MYSSVLFYSHECPIIFSVIKIILFYKQYTEDTEVVILVSPDY